MTFTPTIYRQPLSSFELERLVERYKARCEILEAELDVYRERDKILSKVYDPSLAMFFRLTNTEWLVLEHLLKENACSKESLMSAMYVSAHDEDLPGLQIVDVFVCKLRAKLKKYGVVIETHWGQGYFITPANKAKIRELAAGLTGTMT